MKKGWKTDFFYSYSSTVALLFYILINSVIFSCWGRRVENETAEWGNEWKRCHLITANGMPKKHFILKGFVFKEWLKQNVQDVSFGSPMAEYHLKNLMLNWEFLIAKFDILCRSWQNWLQLFSDNWGFLSKLVIICFVGRRILLAFGYKAWKK